MRKIVNVSDVSYAKGGKIILDKLNFDIEKGTFVSIIGSNGSGKSMLVKVLAGLVDYNGYININGYSLDKYNLGEIRNKVSIVLSDIYNCLLGEKVSNDLVIGLENKAMNREEMKKRLDIIVEEFGLDRVLYKESKELTNSERELVYIASSLISYPDILILDDCMSQLSVSDKNKVFDILLKYKKEKKLTIIMITHNMEDVIYSDRVMVMDSGSIVMDGSVIKVFKQKSKLNELGVGVPFVIDLSLRFMDLGIVNHIYLDMRKLVDDIWK